MKEGVKGEMKEKEGKEGKRNYYYYLVGYNLVLGLLWYYCVFSLLILKFKPEWNFANATFEQVFCVVQFCQWFSCLEFFHAYFKLVPSPLFSVFAQLVGRNHLLFLCISPFPSVRPFLYISSLSLFFLYTPLILPLPSLFNKTMN